MKWTPERTCRPRSCSKGIWLVFTHTHNIQTAKKSHATLATQIQGHVSSWHYYSSGITHPHTPVSHPRDARNHSYNALGCSAQPAPWDSLYGPKLRRYPHRTLCRTVTEVCATGNQSWFHTFYTNMTWIAALNWHFTLGKNNATQQRNRNLFLVARDHPENSSRRLNIPFKICQCGLQQL